MRKLFYLAFFFLFSISLVSAWSYDDSYSYGDADAYAEVEGNYPQCEGISHGNYCVGSYYIDVDYRGDKFYLGYSYTSWSPRSGDNGYSGIPSASPGRKTLPLIGNHPKGYIICAWDYDEANNGDWAWTSQCGGYLINQFVGLSVVDCFQDSDCGVGKFCDKTGVSSEDWSCKIKVCDETEQRCFGSNLQVCENNNWVAKGVVMGKCDVSCIENTDCNKDNISNTFCGGNDILQTVVNNSCSNYKCESSIKDNVIENCIFKCGEIEGAGALCIEKVCDEGLTKCGNEGNSLVCYGNSWFLNENCDHGCTDGVCKSFYSTNTFYMIVGSSIMVLVIIAGSLMFVLSKRKR